MASTRILTHYLRLDNIAYTVRPVSNYTQIKQNYDTFVTDDIRSIVLINCGSVSLLLLVKFISYVVFIAPGG